MKMSNNEYSMWRLLRRLYWDIADKGERKYYFYCLISQIPSSFGNMLRARFCAKFFRKAGKNLSVLAGTRFRSMEKLKVGNNVVIGFDNFIQALGGVTLGDNVLMGPGVKIWSANHLYASSERLIREQDIELKPVLIGNDVWLAANVFIAPGVELPDGVVVGAGAVVNVKKYRPYALLAGNPARMIGVRGEQKRGGDV